ncbi:MULTISPECIES: endonuclease NucS domain-containing protein [unclassified Ruegeria]|uniref:endonuclease NucS domain-containing protein n=1 Tax=unclassified Ruegeria TaxID=2625375 RepID=UPI0014889A10|nr:MULTISPECIES: endonuclease NucS domain-containing protein [unclassified Ruegeria]
MVPPRSFSNGIEIEDVEGGLLVHQYDEAYIARNWDLTPPVEHLIETALTSGLTCMIRNDHPRRNARWPNPRGVVYLAFSPSRDNQWSLAIDTFPVARGDYGHAVFNGKYHEQFVASGLSFEFEKRNKTAGHLVVYRDRVIQTLEHLAEFDHSVLSLNRKPHTGEGFTTEYVIQRELLLNWSQTPWSARYDVYQDEYPLDGGLNSRRIDILARDRLNGDWLIIELKRAEAKPAAIHQVSDYLLALGRLDSFANGQLRGVLVAERISEDVRSIGRSENIDMYEVSWPLKLKQVG